ncbi:COG4315 family predicted lipoprotein [Georgenia subflava]|uniref:Lipoprotein with Yx(FWY)xxD motif n=1 Tax=Georgenia subflava TaxID=1622177 RepID=A0A6N7EKW8_9MICO|nr:hypothetical protein [Georgenia subflava]MPV38081.1 hypothetical protein [Georgenia subflava]
MSARGGLRAATAVLLLGGVLAACGDDGGDDPGGATDATTEAATSEEATEDTTGDMTEEATDEATGDDDGTAAGAATLELAETDLGQILVDGEGMTLYLFTNDSPGTSVCEGDCLVAWPPLEGEVGAGEGVDQALVGTIERSDGSIQASYNDWPLYYWQNDTAPGDTTGQGVNEVWYVIGADGEAIMTMP